MDKYLICVDPDSLNFYSINMSTYDIVIESGVPDSLKEAAEK